MTINEKVNLFVLGSIVIGILSILPWVVLVGLSIILVLAGLWLWTAITWDLE